MLRVLTFSLVVSSAVAWETDTPPSLTEPAFLALTDCCRDDKPLSEVLIKGVPSVIHHCQLDWSWWTIDRQENIALSKDFKGTANIILVNLNPCPEAVPVDDCETGAIVIDISGNNYVKKLRRYHESSIYDREGQYIATYESPDKDKFDHQVDIDVRVLTQLLVDEKFSKSEYKGDILDRCPFKKNQTDCEAHSYSEPVGSGGCTWKDSPAGCRDSVMGGVNQLAASFGTVVAVLCALLIVVQ